MDTTDSKYASERDEGVDHRSAEEFLIAIAEMARSEATATFRESGQQLKAGSNPRRWLREHPKTIVATAVLGGVAAWGMWYGSRKSPTPVSVKSKTPPPRSETRLAKHLLQTLAAEAANVARRALIGGLVGQVVAMTQPTPPWAAGKRVEADDVG